MPSLGLHSDSTSLQQTAVAHCSPLHCSATPCPACHQVIDDKECARRAEEAKARSEPHFYMMEMAPGECSGSSM